MKLTLSLVFVLALGLNVKAEGSSPSLHASFERYVDVMKEINASPALRREWSKHMNLFRDDPLIGQIQRLAAPATLYCGGYQAMSDEVPTSVHKLRVGDIKAIAAMGDSLTAANGANAWTILGCLTNYRGLSWSIGGDGSYQNRNYQLPNIMKQFNPDLIGFSQGNGDANSAGAGLNVAVAGAIAQDMFAQAQELVRRFMSDSRIDADYDWKMVTLFIGGNNLCDECNNKEKHSANTYIAEITAALDYLYNNLPRTFVNLVEIFDITPVADLGNGVICGLVHGAVCGCGHNVPESQRLSLRELSLSYQRVVQELVDSGRYDGRDDFTVVNQPFLRETAPPLKSNGEPDLTYFAPDCFHFSKKGQGIAGKALWNSIITPVGQKNKDWGEHEPVYCPKTPYIPTKQNTDL